MILRSSRRRDQQHRRNQSRDHPRPTMVKCKSQHMHIPHDSRLEGQTSRRSNTIRHCKLQSSGTLTTTKRPRRSLHRKGFQRGRSSRNMHHGTTRKRNPPKLDAIQEATRKDERILRKSIRDGKGRLLKVTSGSSSSQKGII